MANELRHIPVGTELTQAEYEAITGHQLEGQAIGDLIYASSPTQLSRLGIGPEAAFVQVVGGVPAWYALFSNDILVTSAGKRSAVDNPTNAGVHSVGGGGTTGSISLLDNQSFTVTMNNVSAIVTVMDENGNGAAFLTTYASATIVEIGDPSNLWSVTDVDGNPGWAIFKAAGTHVFTIKNYMNATKSLYVSILGSVLSATAPA